MRPKVTLMPVREATITLKKQNKPVRLYKKTSERPCRVLEKYLWTNETKMTLYQEDGKTKLSVRKGIGYSLKHNTSSVKHGEGNLIV